MPKQILPRKGNKTPGSGPKELMPKKINTPSKRKVLPLTGEAAIKEYQRSISPKGMAEANAAAKKAIEKKYPGMFIPETRTKAGVKKVGKKK